METGHHVLKGLIDRRSFIIKAAGVMAASSTLGSGTAGCGSQEINIPCLGPAAAPEPKPGMKYIKASEIGCALDCDLQNGSNKFRGGHATDDGPRINSALAAATAENPITLIIDGSALVSGLFLPAGGYWHIAGLGCGTGFFIKSGTNNDGIHNGPPQAAVPSDPGPPAPLRGKDVSLSNFTVNGNRGDGHDGNSTTGDRRGHRTTTWLFGINLMNLDNVTLENIVVVNSPSYSIRLSNVGNVTVTGCVLHNRGYNTDGLHFDGPANDVSVTKCDFATDDDSIALNCPEGYTGNISRVSVKNCTFNSYSLMRLYTAPSGGPGKFTIDSIDVSNCGGTLSETAFSIGLNGFSLLDSVKSLTISDCNVTAPAILGVSENFGSITLRNVTLIPSKSHIAWVEPQLDHSCGLVRPSPTSGQITYTGSNLTFENCVIYRNSSVQVTGVILANSTLIKNLSINGLSVQDSELYSPMPALLDLQAGTIARLVLDSVSSANIVAAAGAGQISSIQSVSGSGVLGTGWEFPDAVMADGVPYISANSGLPSIKLGGVVELYVSA